MSINIVELQKLLIDSPNGRDAWLALKALPELLDEIERMHNTIETYRDDLYQRHIHEIEDAKRIAELEKENERLRDRDLEQWTNVPKAILARKVNIYEKALKEARLHLLYDNNTPRRMHAIRIIDNALATIEEALEND